MNREKFPINHPTSSNHIFFLLRILLFTYPPVNFIDIYNYRQSTCLIGKSSIAVPKYQKPAQTQVGLSENGVYPKTITLTGTLMIPLRISGYPIFKQTQVNHSKSSCTPNIDDSSHSTHLHVYKHLIYSHIIYIYIYINIYIYKHL